MKLPCDESLRIKSALRKIESLRKQAVKHPSLEKSLEAPLLILEDISRADRAEIPIDPLLDWLDASIDLAFKFCEVQFQRESTNNVDKTER